MKRVVVERFGEPEVLRLVEDEVPRPGPGEVLVRVLAAGCRSPIRSCRAGTYLPGAPKPPFTPATGSWDLWRLPGTDPSAYAVYVEAVDQVWVSDFGGNAIHRFDPLTESFETFPLPAQPGEVRQIHGRRSEVWAAQSADDSIIVIRPAP